MTRPTGMYMAYLEALHRKAEREGRTVPDVVDDPDYWRRDGTDYRQERQ
jgi:hypothetical protein